MGFQLDQVVPWGRSFDEYVRMFNLTPGELELNILGCGDGPASFNSRMAGRGNRVVSCDPIYRFSTEQINCRIKAAYSEVMKQLLGNRDLYRWDRIKSPEKLGRIRMAAMGRFLADFEQGKREGRYLPGGLPALPFAGGVFDLALCSHFLFVYSGILSLELHLNSIEELCRVAAEVRIFPLLDLDGNKSDYLTEITRKLQQDGFLVEVEKVPYEFQRGANEMIRIRRCL